MSVPIPPLEGLQVLGPCDRTYNFRGQSGGGMIFHTGDTGLPWRPQEPGLGRCSVGVTEPIFLGL